ncbi:TPA: hypothetical protein ACP4R4_004454 [Klebsiella pneumoniae]
MKGINQSNGNHLKFLYGVTSTDRLIQHEHADKFIDSCITNIGSIHKMSLTCYRAGGPLTELVLFYGSDKTFSITIGVGDVDVSMVNEDDIRISHKQITLPDTTDTLILVTRIARRSGLKPMLPEAEQFSTVLDFI